METNQKLQTSAQIISLFMVLATAWMAWESHQMSKTNNAMLLLEQQPYINLKAIATKRVANSSTSTVGTIQLSLVFQNPTRVSVTYRFKDLRFSIDGRTPELPNYANMGTTINPSQEARFHCFPVENVTDIMAPKRGVYEYTMEYWGEHTEKRTDSRKFQFVVMGDYSEWTELPLEQH